ncbi:MAG: 30S ribosomal protein S16, partial [Flammeovirgaceae bacterium]|nr:30S ribosomal protein S16 [Flammeovirgaceae bacterium]
GTYNPHTEPAEVKVKEDRALHWLMVGAQPTDTVRSLLSREGIMLKKHLQVGVRKGAITQEVADQRYEAWKKEKQAKIFKKIEELNKAKAEKQVQTRQQEQLKAQARAESKKKAATPSEGESA